MKTLKVVSVIVTENSLVTSKSDFHETPDGNQHAERVFAEKCKDVFPSIDDSQIEIHIEDGFFEHNTQTVQLVHST